MTLPAVLVANDSFRTVSIDGAGVLGEHVMLPVAYPHNFSNGFECISTSNGFVGLMFTVAGLTADSAGVVVIGLSPTVSDQSTVLTLVASITNGIYTTPTGALVNGVVTLPLRNGFTFALTAPLAPYKTIGCGLSVAASGMRLIVRGAK